MEMETLGEGVVALGRDTWLLHHGGRLGNGGMGEGVALCEIQGCYIMEVMVVMLNVRGS